MKEHITETNKKIHLLYSYIGYGNEATTDTLYIKMLQAFWQQIAVVDNIKNFEIFNNESNGDIIWGQLVESLSKAQRDIYIVIDALDQLTSYHIDKLLRGFHN